MDKSFEQLQKEVVVTVKMGYPILISGSLVYLLLAILSFIIPTEVLSLIWMFALSAFFPLGMLISKFMKIHLFAKNPFNTLAGILGGTQAFYIPVFVIIYMNMPEYLPLTVGLLTGSHFLPYMWVYKSKAYLFLTLGVCLSALLLGSIFIAQAFLLVPLAASVVFAITVLLIFRELQNMET